MFRKFLEVNDPVPFLASALDKFPDTTDLLVLADALDDGESKLADVVRQLVHAKSKEAIEYASDELKKSGIYLFQDSIRTQDGVEYEWYGKFVIVRPSISPHRREVINLTDIKDPNVIKGLVVLAALFFANSRNNHYGLDDLRTTKGVLSREGKKQLSQDAEIRFAIRRFLIYFAQFENLVRKINNSQRPRYDDLHQAELLINYRDLGYLWEVPLTMQILEKFVETRGTNPFLKRLASRILVAIDLIHHRINEDEKMVNDLRKIVDIIK